MGAKLSDRLIEKRSIDYVPIAERHGKVWHLWPVWFSGDAHLATVATGVVGVALGGNLVWMAVAVTLGSAFGTFFMAFHSTQGPQLGLPQMIQSRPQFGYVGAMLVWGVALICYIGFNVPQYMMPPGKPPLAVWDVDPKGDNTIIGGHAVVLAGYNAAGARVLSWGNYYTMTWAFFEKFVDEAYALADPERVAATGKTPAGLSLQQLEQAMQALRGA